MPQLAEENKPAGFLIGALTLLTGTVLVGLGVTGDKLASLLRNHQVLAAGAFILTTAGVILGVWALTCRTQREERKALRLGLACVFLGFSSAVVGAVLTSGQREQPSVAGAIDRTADGLVLGLSIQATDLRSKDHVLVSVEPLRRRTKNGTRTYAPGDPLYGASLGPNKAGDIDRAIKVALPPIGYTDVGVKAWVGSEPEDCFGSGNTTGCVTLQVPRIPEAPQLRASWAGEGQMRSVVINVLAHDIAGKRMQLSAIGAHGTERVLLAAWRLSPDGQGVFKRELRVPVDPKIRSVCVRASMTVLHVTCNTHPHPLTTWVLLRARPKTAGNS